LEREGILERDEENSYRNLEEGNEALPCSKYWADRSATALPSDHNKAARYSRCKRFVSLHAGVAAQAGERQKLERLCRYISKTRGIRETAVTSQPFGQMTTDKSGAADQFDRSLNRANELV
jgi:hypothetical protein